MQSRSEYILRDSPKSSSFSIRDSRLNKLFKLYLICNGSEIKSLKNMSKVNLNSQIYTIPRPIVSRNRSSTPIITHLA